MNKQKPYYSTEVYLEQLQTTLKQMESICMDTTHIKREIETSSLQVKAFAQMDENNKKFNQSLKTK